MFRYIRRKLTVRVRAINWRLRQIARENMETPNMPSWGRRRNGELTRELLSWHSRLRFVLNHLPA